MTYNQRQKGFPNVIVLLFLILTTSACSVANQISKSAEHNYIAFKNVNVITIEKSRFDPAQNVLVSEGRIQAVGAEIKLPPETKIIDAAGKYLILSLIDMHVHLSD